MDRGGFPNPVVVVQGLAVPRFGRERRSSMLLLLPDEALTGTAKPFPMVSSMSSHEVTAF